MAENLTNPTPTVSKSKVGLTVGLVIISILLVGGGMLAVQYYFTGVAEDNLQSEVNKLDLKNERLETLSDQHEDKLKEAINEAKDEVKTAMTSKETPNWLSLKHDNYTVRHPEYFKVTKPDDTVKWLTIKDSRGRVEIFKTSSVPERPFGFTGEETQVDIDEYVPKESRTLGADLGITAEDSYEVWLFWPQGDDEARTEVRLIADSIAID